jgi:nitrate reductase delta subunit
MSGPLSQRQVAYKLLSLLLQYPDQELLDARDQLGEVVAGFQRGGLRDRLLRFWAWFAGATAIDLQEHYVATFDLGRRTSLYLTFYSDGDTRRRGQALVRLKRLYRSAGLPLEGAELPDYLPAVLEFCALTPPGLGERVLAEHRPGLELLRLALAEQRSPYRHLVEAVCGLLPRPTVAQLERVGQLIREGPPAERVGLDPFAPPEVVPSIQEAAR